MFIDRAEIQVQSGKGGDGVVHFRREKYVPRGGPDGGDGGRGGDVVLEVAAALTTLNAFHQKQNFRAADGGNGAKKKMKGRSAAELRIPVPPGTLVYDAATAELLGDLVEPGQRLVVARGGRGGRGNIHFATAVHQTPRVAEKGAPGEARALRLELKLIADIGIIGVPNAGKSTLLAAVTQARPKIAEYAFTTLEPNLGVARLDEELTLVLADIPGLIEGAHRGVGLGADFLRHIQRTRVLIHLLDGLAVDPLADFSQINSELALFDADLARKPQIVAFNKMDLPEVQERWHEIAAELKKRIKSEKSKVQIDSELFAISALSGLQVHPLLFRAAQLLQETPAVEPASALPVYRVETDPKAFTIERLADGWRVSGKAIERAASMTYWEHYQSIRRFQRILEALGIDRALRQAGVQEGDTVYVGEHELEWQD
ncbi:MAG: GTPase ObgE [Anaerolineae bacterium]|jgi:GTP-binding protein|nr:GTPase ObgE [Anaerolineae bacterium]